MKKSFKIVSLVVLVASLILGFLIYVPVGASPVVLSKSDSIKVYRINWDVSTPLEIFVDEKGSLNESRTPLDGIKLTKSDVKILEKAQSFPLIHSSVEANCHYPHHAIVYFDSDQNIIASMTVCFMCNNTESTDEILEGKWNMDIIRDLFERKGIPIENPEWD